VPEGVDYENIENEINKIKAEINNDDLELFLQKILDAVEAEDANIIKPLDPNGIKKIWKKIEKQK
jgi:hypothetical protein